MVKKKIGCYSKKMKQLHFGLFIVAFATLMLEVLLTRIFSVTMWYHYAFMAISIAMFGLTAGAVIVYLFKGYFIQDKAQSRASLFSLLLGLAIPISFAIYLTIPVTPTIDFETIRQFLILGSAYLVIAVPFVFSGIVITLALTKFPRNISTLYSADLIGASLGCIALVLLLNTVSGPTAIIFIGAVATLAGFTFATKFQKAVKMFSIALFVFLIIFGYGNHYVENKSGDAPFALRYIKGNVESGTSYEKWNSYSRITVWGEDGKKEEPFGWGLSENLPPNTYVNQLWLFIDSVAGTPITEFSGDIHEIEFLKHDIVNLAHHIRENADVLVVGVGGGRDILSALAFEQNKIVGVEVNKDIIDVVTNRYGDFTGHLEEYSNIEIVNDEARSYVERSKDTYDIIQISLIDTWAATAAGAFVLAENSLYTTEAWRSFLNHLNEKGILSVSRWYFSDRPGEMYRLASLASESLRQQGILNPRGHILIARKMSVEPEVQGPDGVGTLMVSKNLFTEHDVKQFSDISAQNGFEIVQTPNFSLDDTFAILTQEHYPKDFLDEYPIRINAPTDDSPFFFHMLRLKDSLNPGSWSLGKTSFNMKAVATLLILLSITILFSLVFIILPLLPGVQKAILPFPFVAYFAAIGLAFMLVEISLLQRLIIYLGHPVYGLSVILFSLLLAGGIGSYLTKIITLENISRIGFRIFCVLLGVLGALAIFTPFIMQQLNITSLAYRILISVAIVGSAGVVMGTAFPIGMKLAYGFNQTFTPFLWGVNGALSVVGSVLAVVIAISFGISSTFLVGIIFYIIAFLSFLIISKKILL